MRRHISVLLGTMALAAAGFAVPASSAIAATSAETAVVERFWIYQHDGQKGNKKSYKGTDKNFENDEWDGTNSSVSDGTSSVDNNTSKYVVLYANRATSSNSNCSGGQYVSRPWTSDGDLSDNNFDNRADCVVFQ